MVFRLVGDGRNPLVPESFSSSQGFQVKLTPSLGETEVKVIQNPLLSRTGTSSQISIVGLLASRGLSFKLGSGLDLRNLGFRAQF